MIEAVSQGIEFLIMPLDDQAHGEPSRKNAES
jgi:hypothetical protein